MKNRAATGKKSALSKGNSVLVIGDGGWGTALAILLSKKGRRVRLWSAFPEYVEILRQRRYNPRYLPGIRIPRGVCIVSDEAEATADIDLVIVAVPSKFLRRVLERFKGQIPREVPLLSVTKGIETGTLMRASEVIRDVLGECRVAVLSGPSHAEEVARNLPATVVVASDDESLSRRFQRELTTSHFRIYTGDDVIGVELGGALKNVIAVAAGIAEGLGLGDNARAALMTRGMVEIARLGVAMGARSETFMGLSGIGDLITTCVSRYGRNRAVGLAIGRGKKLKDILASMKMVAEGVETTKSARALSRRFAVEMPITEEVYRILFKNKSPVKAVSSLMRRAPKAEAVGK